MKFILRRTITNKQATMGVLYIEGQEDTVVHTQEAHLPTANYSYVTLLLPPGKYKAQVRREIIEMDGVNITAHWLFIDRTPGFPHAKICVTENKIVKGGRISIGNTMVDEFNISQRRDAMIKLIRMCSQAGDEPLNVELEIIEPEDMIVHDYNELTYADMKQQREQEQKIEKLMNEIYGT